MPSVPSAQCVVRNLRLFATLRLRGCRIAANRAYGIIRLTTRLEPSAHGKHIIGEPADRAPFCEPANKYTINNRACIGCRLSAMGVTSEDHVD